MASWPYYEPRADPLHQLVTRHPRAYRYGSWCLWGLAILTTVGDILTTVIGVTPLGGGSTDAVAESVWVTRWVLATVGVWGFVGQKALGLAIAWGLSRLFPRPYPWGLALTVAGLNGMVTLHNLDVLIASGAIGTS